MRTLREWDKYLKQQEVALKKDRKKTPAETTPAPDVRRTELPAEKIAPKPGPIIAVPAKTPSEGAQIESYTVPELDDFVPAVSEPRPIPKEATTSEPRPAPGAKDTDAARAQPGLFQEPRRKQKPAAAKRPRQEKRKGRKASRATGSITRRLKDLPPSVRDFFTADADETAEKYYTKGFKESRGELIERLLDPSLSLEETARVLAVCPTTVRRYTNKGLLNHFRTAGNQRRFRLSDVITFVDSHSSAGSSVPPDSPTREPAPKPQEPRKTGGRQRKSKAAPSRVALTQKAAARKAAPRVRKAEKASARQKSAPSKPARKTRARAAKSRR